MYPNSTFLTPSTSNSCLCVFNNRLPRLARYLQAVFIVTNSFGRLNKLELKLGICNLVHSISDPRAEISGTLVMVRRSSTKSRGTTYWFHCFLLLCFCPGYLVCACAIFLTCCSYQNQEKQRQFK